MLFIISFAGCIEETSPDEKSKIIYVDDDGGADFTKIQDAIDHLTDGGTIFVGYGTYNERLIIKKSLNLIGANSDKTIINYENSDLSISDAVVFVNSDSCIIKGFKITLVNNTSNIIGIKINSSNNTISNNIILYSNRCIYLGSDSKNNTISENTILNASYGIYTYQSGGNNISNNNISQCTTYGVYLSGSYNNIISGNMFSENNYGIRVRASEYNKLSKNTVINNKYGMFFCCGGRNNVIYLNVFKQNSVYNAKDDVVNQWDNGSVGNFWDDYEEKYPDAIQKDDIWDTPYNIPERNNMDNYPLVKPVEF